MTDQAQIKPEDSNGFQAAFIKALSDRETSLEVGSGDNRRKVTIRRWGLSLQFKLSGALTKILRQAITAIPELSGNLDAKEGVELDLAVIGNNLANLSEFFKVCGAEIIEVLIGTLQHNFASHHETATFVESLEPAESIQILMILGVQNIAKDVAKKKFLEISAALQSLSPG